MIKDSISDLFLIFYPTLKRNRKGDWNRLRLYNSSVMYCSKEITCWDAGWLNLVAFNYVYLIYILYNNDSNFKLVLYFSFIFSLMNLALVSGLSVSQTDYLLIIFFYWKWTDLSIFHWKLCLVKKGSHAIFFFLALILSVLLDIFLILKYNEMYFLVTLYIIKSFNNMFGCQIVLFTTRQNVAFVGERFSIAVHPI